MFVTIMFVTTKQPVSRRERPAKAALTRDGIVSAAVRVMRAEGLDRATMRRLAQELDTGPASLYVYVQNTAELHGAVLDRLLTELDLPSGPADGDWESPLVATLSAYTTVLFEHPSLARSVLTLRPSGPHYLALVDALLMLLAAGGVPRRQAAWGVDLLLQQATSTAAEQSTRDESVEAGAEDDALATALRSASPADYPSIAEVAPELTSGTGPERLNWAFRALLAGIAAIPADPTASASPD